VHVTGIANAPSLVLLEARQVICRVQRLLRMVGSSPRAEEVVACYSKPEARLCRATEV